MQTVPMVNCVEEIASHAAVRTSTIRCYMLPPLTASNLRPRLRRDRELTAQAASLLMRLYLENLLPTNSRIVRKQQHHCENNELAGLSVLRYSR